MLLLVKDCREEMVWICLNNILLSSTMVDSFYHRNGCGGRNMEGTMQEPMSFGVVPKQLPPSLESDLSDNGSQDLQKSLAMAMARPIDWYNPIGSMYGTYGNIYHQYTPNVTIYSIHGSYGLYNTFLSFGFFWGVAISHWSEVANDWKPLTKRNHTHHKIVCFLLVPQGLARLITALTGVLPAGWRDHWRRCR